MPGIINFDITGAAEMERLLRELGPIAAGRLGDQALRAGAKPIVAAAQRLAPVRSGDLKKAITAVTERRRKGDSERVVLIGFKPPVSRRAHLAEFGTATQPAQPFVRPALDSEAAAALDEMGRVLARGIEREAMKLAKP